MAQLNVHIPDASDLLARVERHALALGLSASALARAVLDVALEPYVEAQIEARQREREYSSQTVESLRGRFSGALPARTLPDDASADDVAEGPAEVLPETPELARVS